MTKIDFKEAIITLENNGAILTGSRAFGVEETYSDYDYVCLDSLVDMFSSFDMLDINDGTSKSEYNKLGNIRNIKIESSTGEIINLITYETQETVNKFMEVNRRMIDELSPKSLRNRQDRYYNFEFITQQEGIHTNLIINISDDDILF